MTAPTDSQPASPRRRWQFTLRGALVFVMLIGLGLMAWRAYREPYREARRVMALVEQLGGQCATEAGGPDWLQSLLGEGHFQHVTLIDVAAARPEDYLNSLFRLPRLETLVVGGDDFRDEHLTQLVRIGSLRAILLDSTDVSDEAVGELRRQLPDLRVHRSQRRDRGRVKGFGVGGPIDLEADLIDLEPWALVAEHFVESHSAVSLSGAVNGDQELATLRRLTTMQVLVLNNCSKRAVVPTKNPVTDAGLDDLTRRLPHLKRLALPDTRLTDAGLAALARLNELQLLDLTDNSQLTDAALRHVGQLAHLKYLTLTGTSVTDAGLEHLRALTNLETLRLEGLPITDRGLVCLRSLKNLRTLDLSVTRITNAGLDALVGMETLENLTLRNTAIDDAGAARLESAKSLKSLNASGSLITNDGRARLRRTVQYLW